MRTALHIELYTLSEVARALGCHVNKLYDLRKQGALRTIALQEPEGGRWRYYCTSDAVREALSKPTVHTEPSEPKAPRLASAAARAQTAREALRARGLNV